MGNNGSSRSKKLKGDTSTTGVLAAVAHGGHHRWTIPPSSIHDWFTHFHANLLYSIADYLPGHDIARLTRVNRNWCSLERKERGRIWHRVIQHSYGALQFMVANPAGSGRIPASLAQQQQRDSAEWRLLFIRIVTHNIDWSGQAIDQWTANFEPYPMRWLTQPPHHTARQIVPAVMKRINSVWQPAQVSTTAAAIPVANRDRKPMSFTGACHWPSLRDAMTTARSYTSWPRVMTYDVAPMAPKVTGAAISTTASTGTGTGTSPVVSTATTEDKHDTNGDDMERVTCTAESVWFREESMIRGHGILLPNNYQAYIMGSGAVGAYSGGAGGVFWLAMEDAPKQVSFEIGIGSVFQGLCAFPNNQLIGQDEKIIDHIAIPGYMMLTFDRENDSDWLGYVRMDDGSSLRVSLPKTRSIIGGAGNEDIKAIMSITEFIESPPAKVGAMSDSLVRMELLSGPHGGATCWASRLRTGLKAFDTQGRAAMTASFYLVVKGDSLFGIIKSGEMLASCYMQLVRKPDACRLGLDDDDNASVTK